MGLTKAQRWNKFMEKEFDFARKVGAIDDKVTCTKCRRVVRDSEVDMMGRCKRCRR